jgi:CheY-like chemotaxis protein
MECGTLLVIDDEPAITALVKRIAESCGFSTAATSDPEVFKNHVQAAPPAVICLDVAMPHIDGIELLRFLAAENCPSKILIMSGSEPQLLQTALRLGEALGLPVAGTMAKPLRVETVRKILAGLCRGA